MIHEKTPNVNNLFSSKYIRFLQLSDASGISSLECFARGVLGFNGVLIFFVTDDALFIYQGGL